MIIALTGATGHVGRFVAAQLHAQGVTVRALARHYSDCTGFCRPMEWVIGSLGSNGPMAEFVAGADAVVHCALEHAPGRYRGGEGGDLAGFIEANVGGSLSLMCAARSAGVRRFVLLSSRAAYGDSGPIDELDEGDATHPDTHYGACKAALEAFVSSWGRGDGWGICALRTTGVYGVGHPFARTKWLGLIDAIRRGEQWHESRRATEVHGRDVASAVWMLLTDENVAGRIFNCSDLLLDTTTIARIVQRITGAKGPLPSEPPGLSPRVMSCRGLRERGFEFGGMDLLEQTIEEIVMRLEGHHPTSELALPSCNEGGTSCRGN